MRSKEMMFNIRDYGHMLLTGFIASGGKIRQTEFHTPAELNLLKEKGWLHQLSHVTGRVRCGVTTSIIPVRGQIGWLTPAARGHLPTVALRQHHDGVAARRHRHPGTRQQRYDGLS